MKVSPKIVRAFTRGKLKLRHAAPTLLVGSGAISILFGTVIACVATTKTKDIMDEHNEAIASVEENEQPELVKRVYFSTILKFLKLYLPSACAIIIGFVMIFGSHSMLQSRNAMLSAELFSVTQAYNAYREKVREKFGTDLDMELTNDDILSKDENGESKFMSVSHNGPFVKIFSKETSDIWVNGCLDINMRTVLLVQQSLQEKNDAGIYTITNDTLTALGFEKVKKGFDTGLVPQKGRHIDFHPEVIRGEYKVVDGETEFVRYSEPVIRIEIPSDGYILDKIDCEEV